MFHGDRDEVECFLGACDVGRESAFVAETGGEALLLENRLQGVVDLGAPAQRFLEARCADGSNHELLDVDTGVCVCATVEDVHHRDRENVSVGATDVAEQLEARGLGGGASHGKRGTEQSVCAETRLVRGAVRVEQRLVDRALLGCVDADDGRSDLAEHSLHGLLDALSAVACATVAQFDGFVLTRRSAGRHRSPGETSVFEQNLDLNRGVTTGIKDLASSDLLNTGHCVVLLRMGFALGHALRA